MCATFEPVTQQLRDNQKRSTYADKNVLDIGTSENKNGLTINSNVPSACPRVTSFVRETIEFNRRISNENRTSRTSRGSRFAREDSNSRISCPLGKKATRVENSLDRLIAVTFVTSRCCGSDERKRCGWENVATRHTSLCAPPR